MSASDTIDTFHAFSRWSKINLTSGEEVNCGIYQKEQKIILNIFAEAIFYIQNADTDSTWYLGLL